jgi:hypothetical protein
MIGQEDDATIGEIRKVNGYAASSFGKDHDTPYQYSADPSKAPFTRSRG